MATPAVCKIDGCSKPVHVKARGWCRAHYLRWFRHGDPEAGARMQADAGDAARFLTAALSHAGDGCLIWPFATSKGSAMAYIDGKNVRASRWVCEATHGEPPSPDHQAAHSCGGDRLGCISPAHLRWATPSENNQDKLEHGTHNRGERHSLVKLTEADVRQIRLAATEARAALAERFGVSKATIKDVIHRRTWAWLD